MLGYSSRFVTINVTNAQTAPPSARSVLADPANEIVAHVWPQVSHWATEFLLKEAAGSIVVR